MNWVHYLSEAKKGTFTCQLGKVIVRDILTEDLQEYDGFIINYYNECKKNKMKLPEIYRTWKELRQKSDFVGQEFVD